MSHDKPRLKINGLFLKRGPLLCKEECVSSPENTAFFWGEEAGNKKDKRFFFIIFNRLCYRKNVYISTKNEETL